MTNKKVTAFYKIGLFLNQKSGFTLEICSQPREAIHMLDRKIGRLLGSKHHLEGKVHVSDELESVLM